MENKRFTKLFDEDFDLLFDDQWAFRLYTWLIRHATHREYEYNGMLLKPGHYVRSISKLIEDIAYKKGRTFEKPGRATLDRAIKKLKDLGLIETEYPIRSVFQGTGSGIDCGTDYGTLFTVLKMHMYQWGEDNQEHYHGTGNGINYGTNSGSKSIFNKKELNKQELIKKDIEIDSRAELDRSSSFLLAYYAECGFELTSEAEEVICDGVERLNPSLVLEAINKTDKRNRNAKKKKLDNPHYYLRELLNDWDSKGITTIDEVRINDSEYWADRYKEDQEIGCSNYKPFDMDYSKGENEEDFNKPIPYVPDLGF